MVRGDLPNQWEERNERHRSVHEDPRRTGCHRRGPVMLLASGWGATVSRADSTGVYFDASANVGAGPNPFNGTFTGFENVGVGIEPMKSLTNGAYNIGIGTRPLPAVTSGRYNIGIGTFSLDATPPLGTPLCERINRKSFGYQIHDLMFAPFFF